MDTSREFPVRRYEAGQWASLSDPVVTEARVELDVNDGQLRLAMLALPAHLEALAVGFLRSEGALRRREDLRAVEFIASQRRIVVRGSFDEDVLANISLRWTWGTGCGSGGTSRDVDAPAYAPIRSPATVDAQRLLELAAQFHRRTDLWQQTGGVHAAALAGADDLLLFAEDVGRHNAFDKVIGMATLEEALLQDKVVLTTGRLSAEIVSKAVACGVPVLASRSAVTGLGIELARRFHLTLVGFVRGRRLNVYSGFERIGGQEGGP